MTSTIEQTNPENDGETFINIWIHGKTELGRKLSHFYESPFVHPYYGPFNSMEGFWHYIRNKERDDALRSLSGYNAKKYGKKLTWQHIDNFYNIINSANFYKIEQNPELQKLFVESTLPFDNYYLFTPTGDAEGLKTQIIRPRGCEILVKGFEEIRTLMQFGQRPEPINYDDIKVDGK